MEQNEIFPAMNIGAYFTSYANAIKEASDSVDLNALEAAYDRILLSSRSGGTLYVAGNGGSAAISEHLMTDFMKGSRIKVVSLVSNVSMLTALANDFSYAEVFANQLACLGACGRDCVLLISSSGNSPNVVQAAEFAKRVSMPVIGLTGFSGGKLRELSDVSIHVSAHNYGIIEDVHQSIMHTLAQWHVVPKVDQRTW